MYKVTLFANFVRGDEIEVLVQELMRLANEDIEVKSKVFVLENLRDENQYIVTFNVAGDSGHIRDHLPEGSIPVHRKREVNVLYSINALNEIIKAHNDGQVDPTKSIPWEHYRNTFLVTRSGELNSIPTKLYKVVELE
jgi:hypothetical protein